MTINARILLMLAAMLIAFNVTADSANCPRLISQSPYITHQLDYLGLKPCIVGTSRYDQKLNLPITGGLFDPDAEAIAELNADVWITSDWTNLTDFNAIKPTVKHALRLHSFGSMQQIETNLKTIARLSGNQVALQRARAFPQQWRTATAEIKTLNPERPKALLISSCSGQPYAFGHDSWLSDLFSEAGFKVVGHRKRITHLPISERHNALETLIAEKKPQIVFIFERRLSPACRLMQLPKGTRIVTLDGTNFLQPAPVLLKGLEQLKHNPLWQEH